MYEIGYGMAFAQCMRRKLPRCCKLYADSDHKWKADIGWQNYFAGLQMGRFGNV